MKPEAGCRPGRVSYARRVLLPAFFALALFATLQMPVDAVERRPDAQLLFTGSVQGYLEECGCERFPLGGLDRRAGFLRLLRTEYRGTPGLLFDVGNFADEPGPAGRVKTRRLLDAMSRLGYVAVGVSERELALGEALFEELRAQRSFPFLSANLVKATSRETWLEPWTVALAGDLRIGIVSVTGYDPTLRMPLGDDDAVVTIDPVVGLKRALEGLSGKTDLIVLLAALPLEEARTLVRRVPGVDVVLGSFGEFTLGSATLEGETRLLYCGQQGQYVGQVDVFVSEDGKRRSFAERLVSLGESIPSEPAMEAFMIEGMVEAQEAENDALEKLRLEISGEAASGPTYLGSGSCTACHADIVQGWAQTRHRYAWESLERRPSAFKKSCVACHVTGYGEASGFFDAASTPHLQEVGCESCHGPGSEHVQAPERDYGAISIKSCTGCHDAANDPDFNYYEERRLVSHEEP